MKKTIYIILTTIFGILLSYIAHAAIEITYLRNAETITWYTHWDNFGCALHPFIQYSLLIIGIVGGYFLGRFWWRTVYIEKRHWRFRRKSE